MKYRIFFILFWCAFFVFAEGIKSEVDKKLDLAYKQIYSHPDSAIVLANSMLKNKIELKDKIRIYNLLSTAYIAKRDYKKSLEFVTKLDEIAKNSSVSDIEKIQIKNAIGIIYQQMDLYEQSIIYLNESSELLTKISNTSKKYYLGGMNYAVLGLVYKKQLNCEIALEKLKIAVKYFEKSDEIKSKNPNLSVFYYNIADCYISLKKIDSAALAFEKSLEYAKLSKANSLEAFSLKGIAEVLTLKGENKLAISTLSEAEFKAKNIGDLVLEQGIYKGFADNYLALNNWELYQKYNKLYLDRKNKNEESTMQSISQSIDNNTKHIELEQKKATSKNRTMGLVIVTITIFLSLIISYKYWIQLKINKDLKLKFDQLSNK